MTVPETKLDTLSWAQITWKSVETRIPATRRRLVQLENSVKNKPVSIFEAPGYMEEQRANKAALILKKALHPDTVLFEFNSSIIGKEDAYDLITQSVGKTYGFRPIPTISRFLKSENPCNRYRSLHSSMAS
ncbi:hypothetical protein Unana1_03696 [Umbelopsis nana]